MFRGKFLSYFCTVTLLLFHQYAFAQKPLAELDQDSLESSYHIQGNESDFITQKQQELASPRNIEKELQNLKLLFVNNLNNAIDIQINWKNITQINGETVTWEPYQKYVALKLLFIEFSKLKRDLSPKKPNDPNDDWLELINAFSAINVYLGEEELHPDYTAPQGQFLQYRDHFLNDLIFKHGESINFYEFINKH